MEKGAGWVARFSPKREPEYSLKRRSAHNGPTRTQSDTPMKIASSVAEFQRENVVLELESIDRIYLNAYVPKLTSEKGIAGYFRGFRLHRFASTKSGGGKERIFGGRDHPNSEKASQQYQPNRARSTINRASARVIFVWASTKGACSNSSPVVVFTHRGTLTLSTTGLSPMDTLRTVRHRYPCRRSFCPPGTSGSFSGSISKMISPPSLARAQMPKPFHSKGMIQKTFSQSLFPLTGFYKGRQ